MTDFFGTSLRYPVFEIDGREISAASFEFNKLSERHLINGGIEAIYKGTKEAINIEMYFQSFLQKSPFVRYKYVVSAEKDSILTKKNGRDNIVYTGFDIKNTKVTELQFSQFDPVVHSYLPCLNTVSSDNFSGPIVIAETDSECMLLAYEHGAQIPDTYLQFNIKGEEIYIEAVKGNYYNGENIFKKPFSSPWLHYARCDGGKEKMFKLYREFLLKYICENPVSRTPYIFYNTWNYQERNYLINGKKYRDSMNLGHILSEIEVAHKMGIDVYVLDTGWFEKTGDYNVSKERFPDELKQVKQKLLEYNMKLGLWFNPIVAAISSDICTKNPEYRLTQEGHTVSNQVWESEESYWMCLASDYSDYFIEKMIEFRQKYGVTYFKWDGIGQYGCHCEYHNHGTEENPVSERHECYSFKMGMEMIRVVYEATKKCPDIIVDFDVTESHRFVGLGFLSVGKYFLVNNGPYAMDFDLPENYKTARNSLAANLDGYTNIFFFPGAARSRICRQFVKYDFFAPSILFLAHFLPDSPRLSQKNSAASMLLGGNGIWGDLLALSDDDIKFYAETIENYKQVSEAVTNSYPKTKGFIGSSPEIYEKIDKNKGIICFFTKFEGSYTHTTDEMDFLNGMPQVMGAKSVEIIDGNKLKIEVELAENDAAIVFIM